MNENGIAIGDPCPFLTLPDTDVYVRENLMFALLEIWSMRTSDDYVIERENYWKDVLLSREFGHNRN